MVYTKETGKQKASTHNPRQTRMAIAQVQELKQVNPTVDIDLKSIKESIEALTEMLNDKDISANEVKECCEQIEGLAAAIADGVIDISTDCE